ncbi:MAG: serine/threonine-protein phosphatase [Treponema sp.]|nr:serine/threonine-protein phosphatase [Treponema sp.]
MVFVVLNIFVLLAFIVITFYVDRKLQIDTQDGSALLMPLLIVTIEAALLSIVMLFRNVWIDAFISQLMRIVFCFDGIFFVTLSIGLLGFITNIKKTSIRLLRIALSAAVVYIVYAHFNSIDFTPEHSIYIGSEYLFSEESGAREFFPWTWVTLYNGFFKGIVPVTCFVFLTLLQEKKGNLLQRYQGLLMGEAIVVMWIFNWFFQFMSNTNPAFSSLYMYSYLIGFIIIITAVTRKNIPSGRGLFATFMKSVVCYIVPALIVGGVAMFLQPVGSSLNASFITWFILLAIVTIIFSLKISLLISSSTRIYSANYGPALEKELGTIDYSGEMDKITGKMYDIFKRNLETSSVNVYIMNNKGSLETAYSSNNLQLSIPANSVMFETLLNENESVVCYSQVGNKHILSTIEKDLEDFFTTTKSDALFILNEGHNIIGLITLGKRINGDHFKEYDYNTFVNLYSYFFVFGYYMRNISNKDVLSVVNREIKMSSQIITSIQENIDHIKNDKVDIGYLMVPAHNIGGEFIDLIRLTDKRHLFVVGDMSGKGIAASMNMVILKSIIRTYLAETHDFKELVVKINSFIRESFRKGTIFAGLFALIDFETDTMYYINCGIPALMLYTQVYNNVIEIQGSGHILGFVKDISPYISVKTTKLSRGDIILACTDGLVDSHSLRGEQFGKERVQQCLLDNSTYPAQRMVQFTFDSLLKFMSKEMEDDVSILVMKYETSAAFASTDDSKEKETKTTVESVLENPVNAEVVDVEPPKEDLVENVEEVVEAKETTVVEETVEETENVASNDASAENPFDDPDIPDLSNLDEMLKMAGL